MKGDSDIYQKQMHEYRVLLISGRLKSIETLDKTLVSLASGALAISLVFVHEIIGDSPIAEPWAIHWAWICWVTMLVTTLISYWTSSQAYKKAIDQVDEGTIEHQHPRGGLF